MEEDVEYEPSVSFGLMDGTSFLSYRMYRTRGRIEIIRMMYQAELILAVHEFTNDKRYYEILLVLLELMVVVAKR